MGDYLIDLLKLEHFAQRAIQVSMATSCRTVTTWREERGSHIFAKICATAIAALKFFPRSKYYTATDGAEIWDISSVCCLTRSLMDCYNSFFYLIIDDVEGPELDFRHILWNLHSECQRLKMLELMGLATPGGEEGELEERDPRLPDLRRSIEEWKSKLMNNVFYQNLNGRVQSDYLSGKKGIFLTNSQISDRAGIAPSYYKATYIYLSNYVHTYAFSISQIALFRGGDIESLQLFKTVVGYCTGYLCVALRDFVRVFPDQSSALSEEDRELIEDWESILRSIV